MKLILTKTKWGFLARYVLWILRCGRVIGLKFIALCWLIQKKCVGGEPLKKNVGKKVDRVVLIRI
jgi:hypothetical protein